MKIKKAAKELGLNYSTAKSIYQIYKNEGRVHKKTPVTKKSDSMETEENNDSTSQSIEG